jgi:hypothetical protein
VEVKWELKRWRVRERKRERDFTAAPAGRLRLRGGGCFLRRRSGGGLVAPSWPAAAGNPSAGSGRGMLGRAVAFPEEGDDASAGPWSGAGRDRGFRGIKNGAWRGWTRPRGSIPLLYIPSQALQCFGVPRAVRALQCSVPSPVPSAQCCVNLPPGIDGWNELGCVRTRRHKSSKHARAHAAWSPYPSVLSMFISFAWD